MAGTKYAGLDYSLGMANVDKSNGIHYGVISQNEVLQAWSDSSEAYYGDPHCPKCGNEAEEPTSELLDQELGKEESEFTHEDHECDDYVCTECKHFFGSESAFPEEAISFFIDDEEYKAECGDSGDIFITKSKFYTRAQFCSPCAPGAGYLMNPCDDGPKSYCFDHDWFEDQQAPYPVFRVEDDSLVLPDATYYGGETIGRITAWGTNIHGKSYVVTHSTPTSKNRPVAHFS